MSFHAAVLELQTRSWHLSSAAVLSKKKHASLSEAIDGRWDQEVENRQDCHLTLWNRSQVLAVLRLQSWHMADAGRDHEKYLRRILRNISSASAQSQHRVEPRPLVTIENEDILLKNEASWRISDSRLRSGWRQQKAPNFLQGQCVNWIFPWGLSNGNLCQHR